MRIQVVHSFFVAAALTFMGAAPAAYADDIEDQKAYVAQVADELEALENRIGELDEEYGATLDRIDVLEADIAVSQAEVDAQQAELAELQAALGAIAVDRFTSGGSGGLTPLFSTPESFTEELQRGELSRVALDQGAGDTDEMAALVDDLAEATEDLEDQKAEQASLLESLDAKRQQGEELTQQYETEYAEAKELLGDLIVQEQERRVAQAIAEAQERERQRQAEIAAANARAAAAQPRGGGAAPAPVRQPAGGGNGGGSTPRAPQSNDTSAPVAPAPAPLAAAPAPAGGPGPGPGARPRPAAVRCPRTGIHRRHRGERGIGSARRAVPVRSRGAWRRVRLLRAHQVRVGQSRRLPPAPVVGAVRLHAARTARFGAAGRFDLLLLADRPRRDLHRWWLDDPCATDRRRRQGVHRALGEGRRGVPPRLIPSQAWALRLAPMPSATSGIDEQPVSDWLVRNIAVAVAPFRFDLIAGGRSNLTYSGDRRRRDALRAPAPAPRPRARDGARHGA
jgi:peptidoglycan hydrolase CwlO-like protein